VSARLSLGCHTGKFALSDYVHTSSNAAFLSCFSLSNTIEYITANPGKVGLITLTVGGKDLLECNLFGETDFANFQICLVDSLGKLSSNLLA
jgi:hypothetical protein